jgi:uncharacterized protein YqkB
MRGLREILIGIGATILASGAAAQASKPVIAVGEITTAIGEFSTMSIQLALENALQKTNKFTIMERTRLDTLLAERGLSASGITDGISDYSGFSGVDYLIYGSVSNITVENKSVIIASNCDASLSMNIRVVDVATGEIRMSESVNVNDTVNTILDAQQNACAGISLSSINILGEDVSDGIANKMTMDIFPIKVARVNGTQVYLNYGGSTINRDQILTLKSIGEGFVDPDTGEILGAEEETTAVIIATDVRDNYSIGEIVANRSMPAVGDIAYILDSRNDRRSVQSCVKATEKAVKSCDKDPSSKRCGRDSEKKAQSCSVMLDL